MSRYELTQKTRSLTANDAAEVLRFQDYLKDKARLPADVFRAKWRAYELGELRAVIETHNDLKDDAS
jgi:hypothetical protein